MSRAAWRRRDHAAEDLRVDAYGDLVTELAREGYGLYRTNLRYMDLVADQYDFNEPWDGRHNRQLADKMPALFRCPSDEQAAAMRGGEGADGWRSIRNGTT